MPEIVSAPIWTVSMQIHEGMRVFFPMLYPQVTWIQSTPRRLAMKFVEDFQKHHLERGDYLEFLKVVPPLQVETNELTITLSSTKNRLLFPELSLRFHYCYTQLPDQRWLGVVPTLGVEACAETQEQLTERLKSTIRLEWARRKRLQSLSTLVPLLWWDNIELESYEQEFAFFSLAELKELETQRKKRMLPEIAQQLVCSTQTSFGLQEPLEQLVRVSKGQFYRSVLLVGPGGCGKTALIEEWERTKHLHGLTNTLIWRVTAARLLQKLTTDVGWQENLAKLCEEFQEYEEVFYVPNFAQLFEVGRYIGNNISLGESLREPIARGQVVMFSECTEEELAHIELRYPGVLPFFQIIRLQEPKDTALFDIVQAKANLLAQPYGVSWTTDAIQECVSLHRRFTPYSGFPGKPIRFLESMLRNPTHRQSVLDRNAVVKQFCVQTGLPEFLLSPNIPMPLDTTETFFRTRIFGQDKAVRIIVDLLASVKAGLSKPNKPIASFLFVGPTGVGKTEMAKVLAEYLFSSRDRMIRFDMSEFSDLANVMRLTGESMQQDGLLTSTVREQPFCVLLFDEIEKAHPVFYDLLLQILGSGRLTDGRGRTADFCSTVIVMTSNLGTDSLQHGSLGFTETFNPQQALADHFEKAAQREFRPELYNRIDHIVPFSSLDQETLRGVLHRELQKIKEREGIRFREIELHLEEQAIAFLGEHGYHPKYGARHLQRTLREQFLVFLAQAINQQEPKKSLNIEIHRSPTTSEHAQPSEFQKTSPHSQPPTERPASQHQLKPSPSGATTPASQAFQPLRIHVAASTETTWSEKRVEGTGMSLAALANLLTEARRESQALNDGPFVLQLHSQLDILERKKNKDEKTFWKNRQQGDNYSQLLDVSHACQESLSQIQHLETEVLVSWFQAQPLVPELFSQFQQWRQNFRGLKVRLYSTLEPHSNVCTLAIYGEHTHLSDLFSLYRNIAASRSDQLSVEAYWLKEGRQPWQERMPLSSQEDRVVGLILGMVGAGAYLYWSEEPGLHTWLDPDEQEFKHVIEVVRQSSRLYIPPTDVHRQSFFENRKVRRTYSLRRFMDVVYEIDTGHRQVEQTLTETLQRRFEQTITAMILGQQSA